MNKENGNKNHIVIDLGPTTMILLSELILITLKILNYISYSWTLVLSPIILVITGAAIIFLFTLLKLLKNYIF